MSNAAKIQFVKWLQKRDPFLFLVAQKRHEFLKKRSQLSGAGDWLNADFFSTITDTIKNVAPSLLQLQTQKRILDVQLERAKQGLAPLETAQLAPTVKVAAEITPEMEAAATRVAQQSVREALPSFEKIMFLALGVGAFLMLKKSSGKK